MVAKIPGTNVDYHEHHDDDVRLALADALKERKVRLTDRRLLTLYIMLVAVLIGLGWQVQTANQDRTRFEQAVIANCQDNRANTKAFNDFIDQVVTSTQTNPALSPREQKLRAAFFAKAKQKVPTCPPGK